MTTTDNPRRPTRRDTDASVTVDVFIATDPAVKANRLKSRSVTVTLDDYPHETTLYFDGHDHLIAWLGKLWVAAANLGPWDPPTDDDET